MTALQLRAISPFDTLPVMFRANSVRPEATTPTDDEPVVYEANCERMVEDFLLDHDLEPMGMVADGLNQVRAVFWQRLQRRKHIL